MILFLLPINKLVEKCDKITALLLVLQTRIDHLRAWNLHFWIFDIFSECGVVPGIPEFLLASEYEYQATLPALRLMTPLRTGPTAFFAFSPIRWHALHTPNTFSPAAASCALASPAPIVPGHRQKSLLAFHSPLLDLPE
jgi:hypothetical protein